MTIDVTQRDIASGCRHSSTRCPIARAVGRHRRALGWPSFEVFPRAIRLGRSHHLADDWIPLQREITEWIDSYDLQQRVEPITLRIPDAIGSYITIQRPDQ